MCDVPSEPALPRDQGQVVLREAMLPYHQEEVLMIVIIAIGVAIAFGAIIIEAITLYENRRR